MANRKVNLFLVGAMRAGTTSLVELFSRHPDIYVPPIKEPNYFTEDLPKELYSPPKSFSIDRYFEKDFPEKRLHIAHIKKKEHYEKLYSGVTNEKYLLDASTAYLHAPGVAQRIYEYNPEAKIIVLLRDPLERLMSHYKMDIGLGRKLPNFETLLVEQINRYDLQQLRWFDHLGMSMYKESLKSFQSLFESVGIFYLINSNTYSELDKLFRFLEIKFKEEVELERLNPSATSVNNAKKIGFVTRNVKPFLTSYISKKGGAVIRKGTSSLPKRSRQIKQDTKNKLLKIFNQEDVG